MMHCFRERLNYRVADGIASGAGNASGSLDALRPGERARILEIAPHCRGFERRRLTDLGLVPGSVVERAERAPFGGPVAFRLRGVTMALRPATASMVTVETL